MSCLAGSPGPIFLRYPLSTFPHRSPPPPPLLTTPPCVVDGRCSKTLSRPDFSQSREYSSLSFLDLDLDNLENTARPTHLIPLSSYLCSSLASCKESSGHKSHSRLRLPRQSHPPPPSKPFPIRHLRLSCLPGLCKKPSNPNNLHPTIPTRVDARARIYRHARISD